MKLCGLLLAGVAAACGQSIFQVVHTPNENFNNGLYAVSASSPNDIWAVGQSAIHYDGTKWTAFAVPMIKGDNTSSLNGVVDISPTEAWALGGVNLGEGNPGQVIEHWDGTVWSEGFQGRFRGRRHARPESYDGHLGKRYLGGRQPAHQ